MNTLRKAAQKHCFSYKYYFFVHLSTYGITIWHLSTFQGDCPSRPVGQRTVTFLTQCSIVSPPPPCPVAHRARVSRTYLLAAYPKGVFKTIKLFGMTAGLNGQPSTVKKSLYEGSTQFRHWRFSSTALAKLRASQNADAVAKIQNAFEDESVSTFRSLPYTF